MTVEMEGIPYADAFAVEIRWVASRVGENDIKIEVGVEVDFKKSTFLKSRIRSGTIEETIPVHTRLFDAVQGTCAAATGVELSQICDTEQERENQVKADPKQKPGYTLEKITGDRVTFLATGVLVVVFLLLISLFKQSSSGKKTGVALSSSDLALFNTRIDAIEAEMKAIRTTLNEILLLLREQRI
jgi:VAD1 Analog of StAR-related lipid transfer domain